jgi:hypothetical protein
MKETLHLNSREEELKKIWPRLLWMQRDSNRMREMLQWKLRDEECKKIWSKHRKRRDNSRTWLREKGKKSRGSYSVTSNPPNLAKMYYLSKDSSSQFFME